MSGNVEFTFTGSGSLTSPAVGAALQVSPATLSFAAAAGGNAPASQTVTVLTAGSTQSAFTVTLDGGMANTAAPTWLSVAPLAGTTPGVLTVSANPGGLDAGSFSGRILITPAGATAPAPIAVSVELVVSAVPAQLSVAPASLRYAARVDSAGLIDQVIAVSNAGSGLLSFSVSAPSPIPWLDSITPAGGQISANAPVFVRVRINTSGLALGGYKGTIRFSAPNSTIDVPISVFVSGAGAILDVDQTGFQFAIVQGQPVGPTDMFAVLNDGDPASTVHFTASVANAAQWLSVSPAAGTATAAQPGMVSVSVNSNTQTLTPGSYYGLVQVTDPNAHNSPQYIVVVLNVANANQALAPTPTPQGLVFTAAGTQLLDLTVSSASPVNFAASAVTTDGGPWLSVSPASGPVSNANPVNIAVTVNPAGLKAGIYTGLVNIATGSQIRGVNITFIVPSSSGAAAQSESTATAAGCAPTKIALTQTALTTNFSVPAGFPAQLQIAMYDDCANPIGNGSVFASFSNGDPPLSMHVNTPGTFSATWQPGNPTANVTITVRASSGTLQPTSIQITGGVTPNAAPVLYPNGTLNNYNPAAALSPGLIAQVYGAGLAAGVGQPGTLPLPGTFEGTSVMVGSKLAPLYYISGGQINIELPADLTVGQQAILVSANGAFTLPQLLDINPFQAGIAAYADGSNNVIAQHADFSYVNAAHPASPGEVVIIYLAGLGATNPAVPSGQGAPTSEPLARVVNTPGVTVDGQDAAVEFAGLAPGFVGLYQIDLQVPKNARTGSLPLVVSQNGVAGNTTNLLVGQ